MDGKETKFWKTKQNKTEEVRTSRQNQAKLLLTDSITTVALNYADLRFLQ